MTTRNRTLLLAALALCAAAPFLVVAGIPVPPASQAPCCNTADQGPPPVANGDEAFFSIPGGVPNVMIILDDSGSMMDMSRPTGAYPAYGANDGICSGHWLNGYTAKRKATPYDNGFTTTLVTDDPPWGLAKCEAKQTEPTTDKALDWCMFRPTSYYKSFDTDNSISGLSTTRATVYNANPCAAIDTNGTVLKDYSTGVAKPALAKSVVECMDCLNTAGFYMFKATYKDSGGTNRTSSNQIVFKGDFLNGFPPKFIAARKVVKDIAKIDPANPRNTDQVRLGLTAFNSNGGSGTTSLDASDGGKLLVPLGPNCDQSFPPSSVTFATSRQVIINTVNATNAAITAPTYLTFDTSTPLAETLFNVGQYFANTGATSLYQTNFGAGWMRTDTANPWFNFQENSVGAVNAPWAASASQHSFCWKCQTSSVVLVTDGAPTNDTGVPSGKATKNHPNLNDTVSPTKSYDFKKWTNATIDCATCGGALLPKVAYFVNQTDLRPDLDDTPRAQSVSVYTISFGLDATADATALAVLQKTATLGGGDFFATDDADSLAAALDTAVTSVVARATAFSSANTNSIQLSRTSGADAYLGRFRPANSPLWEGHLFAAQIFDEFGQGCDERYTTAAQKPIACGTDPAKNPNIDGDEYPVGQPKVGKSMCSSVYLVDQDCDPVVEDSTGSFKKGHFDPTTHALISDPDAASMYWDAGKALSDPTDAGYRSASEDVNDPSRRRIYTVIDVNGDGKLNAADGLVEFTSANAAALAPLMNLPVAPSATLTWDCKTWLGQIGVCGASPLTACPAAAADLRTKCAEHLINYYRGWDVMDWDNDHCSGPGAYYNTGAWGTCTTDANCGGTAKCVSSKCKTQGCAGGEQRDRVNDSRSVANQEFWKLGDVFHSSPVLVKPPLDKALCALRNTQCVPTLYSAVFSGAAASTTPMATTAGLDAYDRWRHTYVNRPQVVVVGANDFMFHAFDAGVADTGKAAGPDGQYPFTQGTGAELWAFIPPDLLPRLKEGLTSHVYGVDGNPLIKDIWVDTNGDGVKQEDEFKTIAVITERGGGSRWTALDLTSPAAPAFLWTFPETCTDDAKLVAQSWSDFLPRPSPILPVRLAVPVGGGNDPRGRGFEERWIVMVNGGYDPALVRGRAVWMLDAWTGKWLWRYTDADFKALRGDTKASMFPVAAGVGLVDLGSGTSSTGTYDKDGYFDTATWGDLGGNLFVARFYEPGTLDASGHVTNWTAARAFETQRQVDDSQKITDRGEIFFMTGNGIDPGNTGRLMTTFGTGNRERLMQTSNSCGADNVAACCWSGCTVTAAATSTVGACTQGGTYQCTGGTLTYTPAATAGCGIQGSPHACTGSGNRVDLTFSCGAAGSRTLSANLVCGADGVCTTEQGVTNSEFSTTVLAQPKPQYRAYGLWSYGASPVRTFATSGSAKAFDAQRATDLTFAGCTASTSGSCKLVETAPAEVKTTAGTLATTCRGGATQCSAAIGQDLGWMYSYGKFCPMETCSPATWTDERTGTAVVPFTSCTTFSGFRPTGATSGTDPCTSSTGSPSSNAYSLDAFSGTPRKGCGIEDTTPALAYYAASTRNALAAPQNASVRYVMNQRGQINTSLLKIETGSPAQKQSLTTRNSLAEPLYWLEVPQVLHNCRHVDPTTCK